MVGGPKDFSVSPSLLETDWDLGLTGLGLGLGDLGLGTGLDNFIAIAFITKSRACCLVSCSLLYSLLYTIYTYCKDLVKRKITFQSVNLFSLIEEQFQLTSPSPQTLKSLIPKEQKSPNP